MHLFFLAGHQKRLCLLLSKLMCLLCMKISGWVYVEYMCTDIAICCLSAMC